MVPMQAERAMLLARVVRQAELLWMAVISCGSVSVGTIARCRIDTTEKAMKPGLAISPP